MTTRERSLDPDDWREFREIAHRMLDACIDRLERAGEGPVWQAMPDAAKRQLAEAGVPWSGSPLGRVCEEFLSLISPYATGNTHPRFFGWVHGTGTANGMLAELCAAAMNSNCGGRDHAATYVEREVIGWCRQIFGFPQGASGVLTTGTSAATVIALAAARMRQCGPEMRRAGIAGGRNAGRNLTAYASAEAHAAIGKAMDLLGLGSDAARLVPVDREFRMNVAALRDAITADRDAGRAPFCVIATAGTVNTGAFDNIGAIADLCAEEGLWLHVDGAFGAWTRLAGPPWCDLVRGIERADSIAFDFHKWMYVPYDCGCVLVRDEAVHRATFAQRPAYHAAHGTALAGGDPWFCEYGFELSRGFRALKVWFALREFGLFRLGAKIAENCRQAQRMTELVMAHRDLESMAPTAANICCFRYAPAGIPAKQLDDLNAAIVAELQNAGETVFSTTTLCGKLAIRAAITNHRTRLADVDESIVAVVRTGVALRRDQRPTTAVA